MFVFLLCRRPSGFQSEGPLGVRWRGPLSVLKYVMGAAPPRNNAGCALGAASVNHHWQASQSGSSMAQAFGTGAGPAGATGAAL